MAKKKEQSLTEGLQAILKIVVVIFLLSWIISASITFIGKIDNYSDSSDHAVVKVITPKEFKDINKTQ